MQVSIPAVEPTLDPKLLKFRVYGSMQDLTGGELDVSLEACMT